MKTIEPMDGVFEVFMGAVVPQAHSRGCNRFHRISRVSPAHTPYRFVTRPSANPAPPITSTAVSSSRFKRPFHIDGFLGSASP